MTVDGVRAGRPGVATLELSSGLLAPAGESADHWYALLAVVHHAGDPLLANSPVAVEELVRGNRRTALRVARPALDPAPGGSGLAVPLAATLLTRERLEKIAGQLQRVVDSPKDIVRPTERQVLALARAALDNIQAGPKARIERERPGAGIGTFALLGALGFELPGYIGLHTSGGGWVANVLRRGTPDPNMSLVQVPAAELPLRVAGRTRGTASGATTTSPEIRAFTSGMLGAAAAGLVLGPQLADLLAGHTHRDWDRFSPSPGAAAVEEAIWKLFLVDPDNRPASLSDWLPPVGAVPPHLWDCLAATIAELVEPPAARPRGWAAFEADFDAGDPVTASRLRNAYGLLLTDLTSSSWHLLTWLGLVGLFAAMPSVSLLACRKMPHGGNFFKAGGAIDGRAVHEVLTTGFGFGALPPFLVSTMILWPLVDEHTEPFVNALFLGLTRAALVAFAVRTADDATTETRWLGQFHPLAAADAYAAVRALAAGSRRPGTALVYALQTFPAISGLLTLGAAALFNAAEVSDIHEFWSGWSLFVVGLLAPTIAGAVVLSKGAGYSSWFRHTDRSLPILPTIEAVGMPIRKAIAGARVFAPNRLWVRPDTASPGLAGQRYPSGMRPLVRIWWEGEGGDLEIKPTDNAVVLRVAGVATTVTVPAGTTVPGLVTLLPGALPGIRAEAEGGGDPPVPLFAPGLADNGDDGRVADHAAASARFVPVGRTPADGVLLRHAPRPDLTTGGVPHETGFPVVPETLNVVQVEKNGLGFAADLGALLTMAAAPSLGKVSVADRRDKLPDPELPEVAQVFRRWNLDHRRVTEWRLLVAGGGTPDPAPSTGPDPMLREVPARRPHDNGAAIAAAMGWVPLWRAWLTVATDERPIPMADTAGHDKAQNVHLLTPSVMMPDGYRQPTNGELTDGVRFLLDLGDQPVKEKDDDV